jgi:serine phosphatase RsbU (regulator of sigma subunit)
MGDHTSDSQLQSKDFKAAELRSEWTRVTAVLGTFGGLLVLMLVRGGLYLAEGRRGEIWPFAVLLAAMTAYELIWLRFVTQALASGRAVSRARWAANIFVESLLPTSALFLQLYTPSAGPERTFTSPVILGYFLFIIVSTLHLDPGLSRWCGVASATGYSVVVIYAFARFPETNPGSLASYGPPLSCVAFLLCGGFAAGAVARQIRRHVLAALHDMENRAKIAQFEQNLGLARDIQRGLLPTSPPSIPGYAIAGSNDPADETGGDYFDWQQLPDGRVAVTIADVTGHGIGPALIMSACRAYARAALSTGLDLRALANHLNRLLHEDLPAEKFVTYATALLLPASGAAQLISAGHGPLLLYSASQDAFYSYDAQGPPLGLLPSIPFGAASMLQFERGDILVLVTDGLIEWENAGGEQFGQQRLEETVRANRDKAPSDIIAEMRSAVIRFAAGAPQLDDLTTLVVKRI